MSERKEEMLRLISEISEIKKKVHSLNEEKRKKNERLEYLKILSEDQMSIFDVDGV